MFEDCCQKINLTEEVGPVDLLTGKQYASFICQNCGVCWQVGTHKRWGGEELDRLRREAGISSEDLSEARDAYRAFFASGEKRGTRVTFDPEASAKLDDAIRKVSYDPEPSSGGSS